MQSTGVWQGAPAAQGQRKESCPCQGDGPAVPTGTSAPACFASHGTNVQNKLFLSPEEGLAPTQRYLAEGGTAYSTGGAEDTSQKHGMFWQGWSCALAACSGRVQKYTQLQVPLGFRVLKRTVQQQVTHTTKIPSSSSRAPHPPAPTDPWATQDYFTSPKV